MDIKIPKFLIKWFDAFEEWGDVLVWKVGRLNIRRIDLLLGIAFIFCVSYYWFTTGWLGAITGGLAFIFVAMVALWFL